jgi:hypothetical protein
MIAARPQGGAGERRPVPAAPRPQGGLDAAITTPVDRTHAECVEALRQIRARFADARQRVASWQLGPYPTDPT